MNSDSKLELLKDIYSITEKEYLGHKKRVYSVGWNSAGTKLGSASADSTIRVIFLLHKSLILRFGMLNQVYWKKQQN
jgi:hypothetical protein